MHVFDGGQVLNDVMFDRPVVLIGDAQTRTVRAYERGSLEFARDAAGALIADGNGWTMTEAKLTGPSGETLDRIAGHISYWFAWDGYFGDVTEVYAE